MDPISGGLIAGGISALGGLLSNSSNAKQQAAENQKNRDFQNFMSSSAHQREVIDLRAAGLNPILSGMGGGGADGAAGSANMPVREDVIGKGLASALETSSLKKELESKDANIALTNEQQKTQQTQQKANEASAAAAVENANVAKRQSEGIAMDNLFKTYDASARKVEGELRRENAKTDLQMQKFDAINKRAQSVLSTASDAVGLVKPKIQIGGQSTPAYDRYDPKTWRYKDRSQ